MLPLRVLEEYLEDGYCLHGSKQKLHLIEPRKAYCETGRPEGCLNAVYAERHDVRIPIIMALFEGRGFGSYSSDGTLLTVTGDRTFSPGFVHVLPSDTFSNESGEFVSRVPVRPIAIVPVKPSILWDLLFRGDFDLRIPIPVEW